MAAGRTIKKYNDDKRRKNSMKTIFAAGDTFSSKNITFVFVEPKATHKFNLKRHNNVQKR